MPLPIDFSNGLAIGLVLAGKNGDVSSGDICSRDKLVTLFQKDWQTKSVSDVAGTRSTIAVRRPYGSASVDKLFVAQVVDGTAEILSATTKDGFDALIFEPVATIEGVSELSLMFDGNMRQVGNYVQTFTTGEKPYIFYVNTDGSLEYIDLNDDTMTAKSISDVAINVATIRGLYADSIELNDGIWCFYTNSLGELWEARIFQGEVTELTQITMKPEGVTSWLDVWAGFTFDYRIILQLKGDDGVVYTLPSKSRPSGYSLNEHLQLANIKVEGKIGLIPPKLLYAKNIGIRQGG